MGARLSDALRDVLRRVHRGALGVLDSVELTTEHGFTVTIPTAYALARAMATLRPDDASERTLRETIAETLRDGTDRISAERLAAARWYRVTLPQPDERPDIELSRHGAHGNGNGTGTTPG